MRFNFSLMHYDKKTEIQMMVLEYDDFVVLGKGTLSDSEEEWADAYSTMPMHVCKRLMKGDKPVFGVFVAPNVEPNLAQQLFKATWYANGEFKELNIIPFSTDQITRILQAFRKNKISVKKLKSILNRFAELKAEFKNGKEWYKKISEILPIFLMI